MDPGPFIAIAFASPAIIAAVGAIWLGSRALRIWSKRRGRVYESIDEMEERVDFHERLLQQHQDKGRLNSQ